MFSDITLWFLDSCERNSTVSISSEFYSVKHRSELKNEGEEGTAENSLCLSFTQYFVLDDL